MANAALVLEAVMQLMRILRSFWALAVAVGVSSCALVDKPRGTYPSEIGASFACEPGIVQEARAVLRDATGVTLADVDSVLLDSSGSPSEAEIARGMMFAIPQDLRVSSHGANANGRLGTVYAVRLTCGGIVYAFEDGPQRFAAGRQVTVTHGLIPTLDAR